MSAFATVSKYALALVLASLAACATEGRAPALRPVSMLGLRFDATVPQHFDYTCGASSVATMLTYYWNRPTTEDDAIAALRQRYDLAEIAKRRETGLSFDDLIFMAERFDFEAQGAQVPLDQLARLQGPVIVQLRNPKFQHFVVLRRVGDGVFYVSDPIVGNFTMNATEFGREFSGYVLAIWQPGVALPANTRLMQPHDGVSVMNSLEKVINAPQWAPHPIL